MSLKRTLIASGAATAMALALVGGTAFAENTPGSTLVEKIATKFNVDKAEVQKVFDEDRDAHHAEMEKKYEERLSKAVTDGKLTAEQKDKILAKHKELKAQMEARKESFADKTHEERKAEMDKQHEEIQAWLKSNNIPEEYFGFMMKAPGPGKDGPGHGGGMRVHFEAR
jgi:hypothetical protein